MNQDETQARLRASFNELRRADEQYAPPFDRDWQAAAALMSRRPPPAFPLLRLVAAVAAIAAVGVAAGVLNGRLGRDAPVAARSVPAADAAPGAYAPPEPEAAVPIEDWESPTAALLEIS